MQMFDLDAKSRIASHEMAEEIDFWRWVSSDTVGVVTRHAVYHWCKDGGRAPTMVFQRDTALDVCQIVNYQTDFSIEGDHSAQAGASTTAATSQWLLLTGFTSLDNRLQGCMQLFSVVRNLSQVLEVHAAAFCRFHIPGNMDDSLLLAYADKQGASDFGKVLFREFLKNLCVKGNSEFSSNLYLFDINSYTW